MRPKIRVPIVGCEARTEARLSPLPTVFAISLALKPNAMCPRKLRLRFGLFFAVGVGCLSYGAVANEEAPVGELPITKINVLLDKDPVLLRVTHRAETNLDRVFFALPPGVTSFPDNLIITSGASWQASVVASDKQAGKPSVAIQDEPLAKLRDELNGKEVQVELKEPEAEIVGKVESMDKRLVVVKSESEKIERDIFRTSRLSRIELTEQAVKEPVPSTHQLVLSRHANSEFTEVIVSYSIPSSSVNTSYELAWTVGKAPQPRLITVDLLTNDTAQTWTAGNPEILFSEGQETRAYRCFGDVVPSQAVRLTQEIDRAKISQVIQIPVAYSKSKPLGDATWQVKIDRPLPLHAVHVRDFSGGSRYLAELKLSKNKQAAMVEFPYAKVLDEKWLAYKVEDVQEKSQLAAIHGIWIEQCKALTAKFVVSSQLIPAKLKPAAGIAVFFGTKEVGASDSIAEKATPYKLNVLTKVAERSNLLDRNHEEILELSQTARSTEHRRFLEEFAELILQLGEMEKSGRRNLGAVAAGAGLLLPTVELTVDDQRFDELQAQLQTHTEIVPPENAAECEPTELLQLLNNASSMP